MADAQLGGLSVPGRTRVGGLILVLGVLAVLGGAVATAVAKMSADQSRLVGSSFGVLSVGAKSGYHFPQQHAATPDYTGAWIGAIVTGIGVIVVAMWIILVARGRRQAAVHVPGGQPAAILIIASGALGMAAGAVGGLMAKSSADEASYLASQPTSQMSDPSNPIGLIFDPSSAHYVAPDYAVFWIWMIVAGIGVVAVLAGIAVAFRRRRRAA
ncbi:MAG: hypothetical protein M3N46_00150 [Actinomycetota bacterium]|nr:hypothetical protein [Actinomycetota bacterium]